MVKGSDLRRRNLLAQCTQFLVRINLHAEMIDTRRAAALRNRKIYSWVVHHPFRIVGLDDRRGTPKTVE